MSFKPSQYADLGKKAKDVLTEKYVADVKVELKTTLSSGPAVTVNVVRKEQTFGVGDVEVKYSAKEKGVSAKTKHEVEASKTKAEVTFENKPVSGAKVQVESVVRKQAAESGKVTVSYAEGSVAGNAFADAVKKEVGAAVVVGSQGVSFGVDAAYSVAGSKVTKTDATLGYAAKDLVFNASLTKAFSTVGVSVFQDVSKYTKSNTVLAAEYAYDRNSASQTFTVGTLTRFDGADNQLRFKLDNTGKVDSVLVANVSENTVVSFAASFPPKAFASPAFGLALAFTA